MDSDEKQVAFLRSDLQTADARIEAKVQAAAAKVSREEAKAAKDALGAPRNRRNPAAKVWSVCESLSRLSRNPE